MVFNFLKLIFAAVFFIGSFSVSSIACSYADGTLFPTKYELIKETEAVVLADAVSQKGETFNFKIAEVLKGDFDQSTFVGRAVNNSCISYSFKVNSKYLLFLKKYETGWDIWSQPTALMNAPILRANSSPVLKTVRHLIRISSMNDDEREKKELKRLQKLARNAADESEFPAELVKDIEEYLTSPSPNKSYRDLVALYNKSAKEKKRNVLWAFAWGKHAEAADFFTELLKSPFPNEYLAPLSQYVIETKNETLLAKLGQIYPNLNKQARWSVMWALIKTADAKYADMMLAALKSADQEEAGRLAEWFVRYPMDEATEIIRNLTEKDYQKNWELAFNLAALGDAETLDWAERFMLASDKDRWIACYILARSPLDRADQLAKNVINGNNAKDLASLIQGYRESRNPNRWDRLRDVVNLKNRDEDVDYWLKRTLEEMAEDGDNNSAELLKTLEAMDAP